MACCNRGYLGSLRHNVGCNRDIKSDCGNEKSSYRCCATRGFSTGRERASHAEIVDIRHKHAEQAKRRRTRLRESVEPRTAFHDASQVRDAWANFFAALNDPRNFPPTGPAPVVDERRTVLLASMARDLGLMEDFRPDDFTRVYLPQTVLAEMQIRTLQRQRL